MDGLHVVGLVADAYRAPRVWVSALFLCITFAVDRKQKRFRPETLAIARLCHAALARLSQLDQATCRKA